VSSSAASGLAHAALDTGVPMAFGVLTTDTAEQAEARSGPGPSNKGYQAACAALEMARVLERVRAAAPDASRS
jgi:6,7-dimethyl-8-ribityllumazine synthase